MSENTRFLKFIPSEEAFWLMKHKPNAFNLLTHIANTARRTNGNPDGLLIGQCHLQSWNFYGLTEREYRTAKEILVLRKHIIIIETNRTRQKSTTGSTTKSTLVQLCSSTIWDINPEDISDRISDRPTTKRRPTDDKQEGIRNKKKDHHPDPSSKISPIDDDLTELTDDFSSKNEIHQGTIHESSTTTLQLPTQHNINNQTQPPKNQKVEVYKDVFMTKKELEECIAIKGSFEAVQYAVEHIIRHPSRKSKIINWPNAMATWQIKASFKPQILENEAMAKRLEILNENNQSWRCEISTDKIKDQRGLLFYSTMSTGTGQTVFVPFVDSEFSKNVTKILRDKKMQKGLISNS